MTGTRSPGRSRCGARGPGRRSPSGSTRSRPGRGGSTLSEPPHKLAWALDGETGRAGEWTFGWRRSSACSGCRRPSTACTRRSRRGAGGNIDCKELVAGTTLYLPIPVDGALLSAGDRHVAQGDGRSPGPRSSALRRRRYARLRDDLPLEWPVARIEGAWLAFGFDEDLGGCRRSPSTACRADARELGLDPERRAGTGERRRRPARDAGRERDPRRPRRPPRRRAGATT